MSTRGTWRIAATSSLARARTRADDGRLIDPLFLFFRSRGRLKPLARPLNGGFESSGRGGVTALVTFWEHKDQGTLHERPFLGRVGASIVEVSRLGLLGRHHAKGFRFQVFFMADLFEQVVKATCDRDDAFLTVKLSCSATLSRRPCTARAASSERR